jgi:hypothetical protein
MLQIGHALSHQREADQWEPIAPERAAFWRDRADKAHAEAVRYARESAHEANRSMTGVA